MIINVLAVVRLGLANANRVLQKFKCLMNRCPSESHQTAWIAVQSPTASTLHILISPLASSAGQDGIRLMPGGTVLEKPGWHLGWSRQQERECVCYETPCADPIHRRCNRMWLTSLFGLRSIPAVVLNLYASSGLLRHGRGRYCATFVPIDLIDLFLNVRVFCRSQVTHRGGKVAVSHHLLHGAKIHAGPEELGAIGRTECLRSLRS